MTLKRTIRNSKIWQAGYKIGQKFQEFSAGTQLVMIGIGVMLISAVPFLLCAGLSRIGYRLIDQAPVVANMVTMVGGFLYMTAVILLVIAFILEAVAMCACGEESQSPQSGWHYGFATAQVAPLFAVLLGGPLGVAYLYSQDVFAHNALMTFGQGIIAVISQPLFWVIAIAVVAYCCLKKFKTRKTDSAS